MIHTTYSRQLAVQTFMLDVALLCSNHVIFDMVVETPTQAHRPIRRELDKHAKRSLHDINPPP